MDARRLLAVLVVLALLIPLTVGTAAGETVEERTRRIGKGLQCPVCQGASVADSTSELAEQMRGVIQRKVEAGESDDQIVQYFVERYGDAVLQSPPRRGIGLAVWLGPLLVLGVGGALLGLLLRSWLGRRAMPLREPATPLVARQNGTATSVPPDPHGDRVRLELERFRRES